MVATKPPAPAQRTQRLLGVADWYEWEISVTVQRADGPRVVHGRVRLARRALRQLVEQAAQGASHRRRLLGDGLVAEVLSESEPAAKS